MDFNKIFMVIQIRAVQAKRMVAPVRFKVLREMNTYKILGVKLPYAILRQIVVVCIKEIVILRK